jgi:hypothetical protein
MARGTVGVILALVLGVALLLPPHHSLAPPGMISGARAATLRLPHRWPAVPWYLAGGAPAPLVAWQPIGAASQSASYAPVVGSLAASAVGAPGWSAAAGWEMPDPMTGHVQLGTADSAFARGFAATASGTLCVRWRNRVEPANDLRHIVGTSSLTVGRGWVFSVDDRDLIPADAALVFTASDGTLGNYIAAARTENNVASDTAPHVACVQMVGVGVGIAVWVDGVPVAVNQQKIADRAGVSGVGAVLAGRGPPVPPGPFPGPVDVHALAWWPGDAQPSAAQIVAISAAMGAL